MVNHLLSLVGGKVTSFPTWEIYLLVKRIFNEDVVVPEDKVLTMHSPTINGCLEISGEVYIL